MKINTKIENESNNGICFYEKNSNPKIFHLIFANEGSDAGEYYNQYTLQFLENSFEKITDLKGFNIMETLKERFKEVSKEIIEKLEEEICFNDSKDVEIIKVIKPKEITLKKCYIDELGILNGPYGFGPNYNYYEKDGQIIIRLEAPGNCKIESSIEPGGEYTVIKIRGKKEKDIEPIKIEDNIFNSREFGNFYLEIPLKPESFIISNEKPKFESKNGLIILSYKLEKKREKAIFNPNEKNKV